MKLFFVSFIVVNGLVANVHTWKLLFYDDDGDNNNDKNTNHNGNDSSDNYITTN